MRARSFHGETRVISRRGAEAQRRGGFACDMAALSPAERSAHAEVMKRVFGSVRAVENLPEGYAFSVPVSELVAVSEFVPLERRCCPFFGFSLEIAPEGDVFELRITGPEGVRPFIQAEFGTVLPPAIRVAFRATRYDASKPTARDRPR